jgi:hypothetical protein
MNDSNTFREIKLALKDLSLWSENPRFPQAYLGKPENELIDYIVSVPHYKIEAFGKEVVEDFDMPIFEKFAVYDGEGYNIAYEGNRRLTVYKLLVNPDLCSDIKIREYFRQLKRSINIDENFKIDCVVSNDKLAVLRYVNRKHLNNNNEVAWGTLENSHAKLRWLDDPNKLAIFQSNISIIIRNLSIPQEDKDKVLGRGYVTTLFRILNSRTAAKYFKLVFDDDNNLISGIDGFKSSLQVIIYDILGKKEYKKKKFSRLNAGEVEDYLKSIVVYKEDKKPEAAPKSDNKTSAKEATVSPVKKEKSGAKATESDTTPVGEPVGKSGATVPPKKPKPNKKSTQRKYLIPSDCDFVIAESKINNIFIELKKDLILDDSAKAVPNAVGILFRVFLEISIDYYAEKKHGHIFKKEVSISQKIPWAIDKLVLAGHKKSIFKHVTIVGAAKREHSYLSIEKFHQYVHSTTLEPSSSELKTKWNLLEPFFQILWDELK